MVAQIGHEAFPEIFVDVACKFLVQQSRLRHCEEPFSESVHIPERPIDEYENRRGSGLASVRKRASLSRRAFSAFFRYSAISMAALSSESSKGFTRYPNGSVRFARSTVFSSAYALR